MYIIPMLMPILLYKSWAQEGLHYMDMFDRKIVKIDYYKCVFVSLSSC